jgi:hypothetical protein
MSQQSLQDILGKIMSQAGEEFERAKAGPTGNWEVDLPLNLEYRLKVTKAEFSPSKSSGRDQIVLTYEVQEPAEFAGAMIQEYQNPNPDNTIGISVLSKLFGALDADMTSFTDYPSFVQQFEGRTIVAAVRKWGEQNDRTGLRYVNKDVGQSLKTDVKPPKQRGATSADLRPDIQIPKPVEEAQVPLQDNATITPTTPSSTTTANLPGGVNLPPGLRS